MDLVSCYNCAVDDPKFGTDPIDVYTKPINATETKLSRIFKMQARRTTAKPGRSLLVTWDARLPLIDGFINKYSYLVSFDNRGNVAGNHYHEQKRELFCPVVGDFIVLLEDIKTKKHEEIKLSAKDCSVIFIQTRIAHTVVADSDGAVLLVTANHPGTEADEFPYKLR